MIKLITTSRLQEPQYVQVSRISANMVSAFQQCVGVVSIARRGDVPAPRGEWNRRGRQGRGWVAPSASAGFGVWHMRQVEFLANCKSSQAEPAGCLAAWLAPRLPS